MTATYRLQLHAGFGFADAEAVVPHLADLGVSHLYLSPVLQAVPGSLHGYDVLDHTRVNEELGGEPGLVSLATTAREHGLGLVVDVVPNHMALVAPEHANAPLWRVLAEGRQSPLAHWFDVDWDAGGGKLGLPLLGDTLEATLAAGDLVLDEHDGRPVVRYYDHVFPLAAGTGAGAGGHDVRDVLDRQHYRLAFWREKDAVLNYRRFFDVDTLIAVRVEDDDVFAETHRLLLDLNHRGLVEGFRIDHPDGLADPAGYLRRLREAARPGTAIWVEKILEGEESLPDDWACEGTTGYDAVTVVSAALVDTAGARALTGAWLDAGGDADFHRVVHDAKRLVTDELLAPERARLTRRAAEALPEADPERLAAAVAELLVAGEVYRAYVTPGEPATGAARDVLEQAVARAVARRHDLGSELDGLRAITVEPKGEAAADFAVRLQQTWGPVMAKGIEDTAFYRYHRMVALNEVGGDPLLLDEGGPERLHAWAEHQQERWPLGLTALSTHDTKRSEDVRARLLALSGDAESWTRCADAFTEAARRHDLDAPTAQLVWQTLAGVGPVDSERLDGYLVKAAREAKQHTAWVDGDEDYERRLVSFAEEARVPGELKVLVDTAVNRNREAIRATVLGQKLLQLMLPGAPDLYQGTEVVNLSLVDPDNRRPVDYDAIRARLAALRENGPFDLDDEKLLVTATALWIRREQREAFSERGSYQPLSPDSRHLVGFVRGREVAVLATRAPQRLEAMGGWGTATVRLADGLWRDELTQTLHGGGENAVADLLATYPVALLRRVHMP